FFFRLTALEMLAVALAAGALAHLAARLRGLAIPDSPIVPAVVAVALVGPRAPLAWIVVVALLAAGLEVARNRLIPSSTVQVGLLAYAVVFLVSRGALAAYVSPGGTSP